MWRRPLQLEGANGCANTRCQKLVTRSPPHPHGKLPVGPVGLGGWRVARRPIQRSSPVPQDKEFAVKPPCQRTGGLNLCCDSNWWHQHISKRLKQTLLNLIIKFIKSCMTGTFTGQVSASDTEKLSPTKMVPSSRCLSAMSTELRPRLQGRSALRARRRNQRSSALLAETSP